MILKPPVIAINPGLNALKIMRGKQVNFGESIRYVDV